MINYDKLEKFSDRALSLMLKDLRQLRTQYELPKEQQDPELRHHRSTPAEELDKQIYLIRTEMRLRRQARELQADKTELWKDLGSTLKPVIVLHKGKHGTPSALAIVHRKFTPDLVCHYNIAELRRYPPNTPNIKIAKALELLTAKLNHRGGPEERTVLCKVYIEFGSNDEAIFNVYQERVAAANRGGNSRTKISEEGERATASYPIPLVITGGIVAGSTGKMTSTGCPIECIPEGVLISTINDLMYGNQLTVRAKPELARTWQRQADAFSTGKRQINQEDRIVRMEEGGELVYAAGPALYYARKEESTERMLFDPDYQAAQARRRQQIALKGKIEDARKSICVSKGTKVRKPDYVSSREFWATPWHYRGDGSDDDYNGPMNVG